MTESVGSKRALDPKVIASQSKRFSRGLRGYVPQQVDAYLKRMALVAETITGAGQLTALPDGFTPEAMRQKRFNVEWQGYDREEVHAFLSQLGRELQERLDKEQRSAHVEPTIIAEAPAEPAIDLTTQLFLPPTLKADLAQAATSGVYEGAFVEVEGNRTPVVFFAADKLVSAILSGVDEFGVQAFANAIIVDHLSEPKMREAFDKLEVSGELRHVFGPR